MRPIDGDALQRWIKTFLWLKTLCNTSFDSGYIEYIVENALENAPTLDLAPVVHGEWRVVNVPKRWGGSTLRCSECNTGTTYQWTYCPNCGAKMDGGKTDGCL